MGHSEKEKVPVKDKAEGILKFTSSSKQGKTELNPENIGKGEKNISNFVDAPDYGSSEYWEDRFKNYETTPYEWYLPFEEVRPYFEDLFPRKTSPLLELGCGNSQLAEKLVEICGYENLNAVDLSDSAIRQCQDRLRQ